MNTEQLKKEFENKFVSVIRTSYGDKNKVLGLVEPDDIWNFFLPHLISSDEIKREAYAEVAEQLKDATVRNIELPNGNTVLIEVSKDFINSLTQSKEGGE